MKRTILTVFFLGFFCSLGVDLYSRALDGSSWWSVFYAVEGGLLVVCSMGIAVVIACDTLTER
jgi:hypothetical protein